MALPLVLAATDACHRSRQRRSTIAGQADRAGLGTNPEAIRAGWQLTGQHVLEQVFGLGGKLAS